MKKQNRALSAAVLASGAMFFALTPASLLASAGRAQPASDAAPAVEQTKITVTVKAVQGKVHVVRKQGLDAERLKAGDTLDAGAVIMTTGKSAVQFQVGDGQIFTVDAFSAVRIKDLAAISGTNKTALEMEYGRITFDVTSTSTSNDVTITAPDATLAVKGTSGGLMSRPGFEPLAFGGEMNKGRFDVRFMNKVMAVITGSEKSSGHAPAKQEKLAQHTDTGAQGAREDAETEVIVNSGFNAPVGLNTPGPRDEAGQTTRLVKQEGVITGPSFFSLNALANTLTERDLYFGSRVDRKGISGTEGVVQGAAIVTDPDTANRILLVIDNVAGPNGNTPVFRVLNIDDPAANKFVEIGRIDPTPSINGFDSYTLFGLGILNNSLYSSGIGPQLKPGQIFEIDIAGNANGPALTARMDLGIGLEPAMTAAASRNSLFVASSVPQIVGAGRDWMILELNPTSNFIVNGWTSINPNGSNFANMATTVYTPGYSFNSFQSITGMAWVNNTLVLSGVQSNGQPLTVHFNPAASGGHFDPNVRLVDAWSSAFQSQGMSSYSAKVVALNSPIGVDQRPQGLESRLGEIAKRKFDRGEKGTGNKVAKGGGNGRGSGRIRDDGGVSPTGGGGGGANFGLFGQMGYSSAALSSGAALLVLREHILLNAADRQAVISSGNLNLLPTILNSFVNQPGGMGLALTEFYHQTGVPGFISGGNIGAVLTSGRGLAKR